MQTYQLVPHPAHPPSGVSAITARIVGDDARWLRLRWRVEGAGAVMVPPFAGRVCADGLWRATCFEAFVRPDGGAAYVELNLSPSEAWAVYDFAAPRTGMADRPMPRPPVCDWRPGRSFALFDAAVPAAALPTGPAALGLTAIIAETGGRLSYWALAHRGAVPDFHDPACFTAQLVSPDLE